MLIGAALLASAAPAPAHDPSAWGGLFRSRDDGASWLPADAGLFVGAALALAVSPADANHLLYATDTRLLRSRNGGRDWDTQAPDLFNGPTLAVTFAADGRGAWAATPAGVFVAGADFQWRKSDVSEAAIPARGLLAAPVSGRVYLRGARGLFASMDGGRSFSRIGPAQHAGAVVGALLALGAETQALVALFDGRPWFSADAGLTWAARDVGLPPEPVQVLAGDAEQPPRLWAASGQQVHLSDDFGVTWRAWGAPIGPGLSVQGIAIARSGEVIVLSTHKGLLRSADAGRSWAQVEGALPVHLEAGPLQRDPHDAQTLYAGFALVPYAELRRRAEQGSNLLSRLDPVSLAGAAAFLVLLLIGGSWAARGLARAHRNA